MKDYILSNPDYHFGVRILGEFLIEKLSNGNTWLAANWQLAELSGLSERTIQRVLKTLKDEGFVTYKHDPATQQKILALGKAGQMLVGGGNEEPRIKK